MLRPFLLTAVLLAAATPAFAAEIHVAKTGADTAPGSASQPLLTISAAATKAMPGDMITVHAGVYREWVKPPRGGESDTRRIVYQAAPGEKVTITGSEAPKGWEKVADKVWKITLPNRFFGANNPFDELLYGSWLYGNGKPVHTGFLVLNGKRLPEAFAQDAVTKPGNDSPRWFAKADGNGGPIVMNFEWIRPVGGKLTDSMHASVENGDQASCVSSVSRWPFAYLKEGSILHFDGTDFGAGTDELEFNAATLGAGGKVEMHLGKTPDGPLLGVGEVVKTGGWEKLKVFKLKMSRKLSGKQDVCFVIRAPALKPDGVTEIYARLPAGTDPNSGAVEISVRPSVFFPEKTGYGYITVRGFTLMNAATNWAPPSAFQPGLIGPRWSVGWIIEDNEIANSRCSGVSLGRNTFGHAHHYQKNEYKIYPEPGSGETEERLRDYFDNASWDKNEAGQHIVRNNRIHGCGQTGIVGSSGCAYSLIEGNDIWDIHRGEPFGGAEMAGIKLHFAVDAILRGNRIHDTTLGLWLDWGAQGARVTGNLFHGNSRDAFVEVCHGPVLFDNNLLLSGDSLCTDSQGLAHAHNLIAGGFSGGADTHGKDRTGRFSYFYKPHDTVSLGKLQNNGGDWRWYNNLLAARINPLGKNAKLPVTVSGNAVFGAKNAPAPEGKDDDSPLLLAGVAAPKLVERKDGAYLVFTTDAAWRDARRRKIVNTALLGKAVVSGQAFENPDGSPLTVDTDYFGKKRDASNPFPGPFETPVSGEVKVWPK